MTSPFQPRVGPAARAVQTLIAPLPGTRPPTTAQTLSALLDFQGTVQLAHCLRGGGARPTFGSGGPLLLGDYVRRRIEAMARAVVAASVRLPAPADLHRELAQAGAFGAPANAREITARLARTWRDHFLATLSRGRADIAALREEVVDDLRHLGGVATRLESLDGTLHRATDAGVVGLHERLAAALQGALTRSLDGAVAALSPLAPVADVEAWFTPGGAIGEHLARGAEIARTLARNDAALLVTLVDTACTGGPE